jgi:enamine deaminase RidA (YjgF/YER057c/UK114 family)
MGKNTGEKKMGYGQQPNITRGGDYLYVTMRCGRMNHATGEKATTIQGQTINLLNRMDGFLKEEGASLKDVVLINTVVAHTEDVGGMNDAYYSVIKDHFPARTFCVAPLHLPDMLIQGSCIAYSPSKKKPATKKK